MKLLKSYLEWLGKKASLEIEKEVYQLLPRGNNQIYLDCGCDDGEKTVNRAKIMSPKRTIGIDSQIDRLKIAEKKGIETHHVDLNKKWPLKSESIDVITATEVIEHLGDLDIFFEEIRRVLSKSGKIIISTENLAAYHNILALLIGNQPYTGPYLSKKYTIGHHPHNCYRKNKFASQRMAPHLNVMTSKALCQLLKAYNFKIEKAYGIAFYPFPSPISKILSKLDWAHASYVVTSASKS